MRHCFLFLYFEYIPRDAENKMFAINGTGFDAAAQQYFAIAHGAPQMAGYYAISPAAILIDSPRMAALKK